MSKCTKCGQEITKNDEYDGNYREIPHVGGTDYKHIRCPGQPERKRPEIDWDAPLPEASPASWIVK
jgi:hypothetical protein